MKRTIFWISIAAVIIQACACIAMGLEVFVTIHSNPDTIMIEAYIIGVCLIIEIASAFYRIDSRKQ